MQSPHRRAWLVLAIGTAAGVAAAIVASRLELRTSFAELLPSSDPAVVVLKENARRMHELGPLMVAIKSPDRAANLRYAAALTAYLKSLPPRVCALAAYEMGEARDFIKRNAWLYASLTDLTEGRDRLRTKLLARKNPLALDLDADEAGGEPASLTDAIAARRKPSALERRFPDGAFTRGDYAWVLALPSDQGGMFEERAGEELVAAVAAFTADHPPAGFHPQMSVTPTGPVMIGLENRRAVEQDVVVVTVVCVLVIGLSIALFFRSLWAIPLVVVPAAIGGVMAFAAEKLVAGYLNSSTAFLGSIIFGNGINHGIVFLARYQEIARTRAAPVGLRLRQTIASVWKSTLVAALAAAAGYAALALTSFRGYSHFGLMGAVGSLACWLAAFTVLPAIVRLLEGKLERRMRAPASLGPLGRWLGRRFRAVAALGLLATVVASVGFGHFLHDPFEYDLRRLRADTGGTATRLAADGDLLGTFGHFYAPIALVADRLAQVPLIPAAVRAADRAHHPRIGHVVTIYDVLPGTEREQTEKLRVLAEIRRLLHDPAMAALPASERRQLEALAPPAGLRALTPADLPALVRYPFTEKDGTVGRVVLAYHAENVSLWDGKELLGVAGVLQNLHLADGSTLASSGQPMVIGAMLRSILRDSPVATGLAFVSLLVLVLLAVRPRRAAVLVAGSVALGVAWMIGAAGLCGVRVTFLNFIAIPITLGIGAEYALNMVGRLGQEKQIEKAVASTGAAVVLCSWTTIVGYGSLLAAHSQALRGFGAMAILGEIFCLAAAVIALPVGLLLWREGPAGRVVSAGVAMASASVSRCPDARLATEDFTEKAA
jgi:predicted RND superfamily exporter protein